MENNIKKKFLLDDTEYETILPRKFLMRKPYQKTDNRKVIAFIPGNIVSVHVSKGAKVKMGEKLLVLEAMKMRNELVSPVNGVVKDIFVKEGNIVSKGQLLIEIE
jgi:biotin carboxyl carrier protein